MTTADLDPEGVIALLAKVLRGSQRLDNPACSSSPELFDTTEPLDAVDALEICGRCACLEQWRLWAEAQPRGRLNGVVAGKIYHPRPPSELKRKKPKPKRSQRPKPRPAAVPA